MIIIYILINLMIFMDLKFMIFKYFMSCLLMMLSLKLLFKLCSFNKLMYISLGISMNSYSFMMIMLSMWIFGIIFMFLKSQNILLCLKLNMLLLINLYLFFLSSYFFFFYFMFEVNLILIFFIIIKWGVGEKRLEAAYYMMFYTLFFSLPFLMFLFILMNKMMIDLMNLMMVIMEIKMFNMNCYFFMFMMMTFFVKIPMYLFHGWLLKAHVEAPVFGSMILAAILLKLGTYGLLQMMMMFFNLFIKLKIYIMFFSIMGCLILSILCLRQMDMKILVAYSSIVHMGILISSMMTFFKISVIGGYIIMVAHGLCSSGLFYLVNVCYQETNSRLMLINKGMMSYLPKMSLMWFLLCSSNMSAPISLNLVGEIFLLMGVLNWMLYMLVSMILFCMLSFIYSLYLFCYIQHGHMNFYLKICGSKMIDYLVLILHWIPLNFMFLKLDFF
uniref:NADH-ubiquinone oxidoreductase chain 4 n=1 Tax=Sphecodes ephippius TaxID=1126396 RepID=A0A0S2LTC3_9HYME|nr:NADH dehydrogenase subunit 4 [Sphecodes ephippius]